MAVWRLTSSGITHLPLSSQALMAPLLLVSSEVRRVATTRFSFGRTGGPPFRKGAPLGAGRRRCARISCLGTRLNNSFQRLNNLIGFGILTKFSQFFQNFLQLSANFDIFWRCSWNSDKISSRFRRKIPILMRFSWNLNWINYSTYSKMTKLWRLFCWNFEIWAVQKYENLVDLENPEKMSIWLLS